MDFYERIKSHVKIKGLTIDGYFSSLFAGDKNKESFSGWKKRHIYPRADEALILAKDMRTTVEELIDGDTGAQYLREYIQEKGWGFSPPKRIADMVENLLSLDENELIGIRANVEALAEAKNERGTGTDGLPG